ncbi:unnamed protein product [Protopolystoma xenopodis]|uniref:Uncharacterized protein n=1 Tax=Protopolystoma xenopodis TaxID=117903 RepID=A0A3S5BAS2_9PLAT|nr:unnamed protein product [Protopolystoma xenopodis]
MHDACSTLWFGSAGDLGEFDIDNPAAINLAHWVLKCGPNLGAPVVAESGLDYTNSTYFHHRLDTKVMVPLCRLIVRTASSEHFGGRGHACRLWGILLCACAPARAYDLSVVEKKRYFQFKSYSVDSDDELKLFGTSIDISVHSLQEAEFKQPTQPVSFLNGSAGSEVCRGCPLVGPITSAEADECYRQRQA